MSNIVTALVMLNVASIGFLSNLRFSAPLDPLNPVLVPIPSYYYVPSSSLSANVESMSVQLYSNQLGKIIGRNNAEPLETIYLRTNIQTQELEFAGTNLDLVPADYDYKYSYKTFINTTEMAYSWKKLTHGYAVMTVKTIVPIIE
jgi:hypothetical protein